jgi:2-keto-4-pentenoate hydratase
LRAEAARLKPIAADRFAAGMGRQLERFHAALAAGMPRRGWKIGINVPEVLARLDLPHPGVGWLDGHRVLTDGAQLPLRAEARLHAEPEVAVRIARAVAPGCSADLARQHIAAVHPALEIVSYAKPTSGVDDAVAHCMFHDATILGAPALPAAARDLGSRWPVLRVGDRPADPPRADLVPSDLGELVAFVADYLAAFGESLEAGDLVLSGSFTASAAALAGGVEVSADFGPLGRVSARIGS